MTPERASVANQLHALRAEFDRSFALAPKAPSAGSENLLAIRAGGAAYAIRLAEIGGLHADRAILALPTSLPELLGVTSLRGQIVPVYDLASLLGAPRPHCPRWMVLVHGREPLALAFDTFEVHLTATAQQLMGDAVQLAEGARPIIDMRALIDDIERRAALAFEQRSTDT